MLDRQLVTLADAAHQDGVPRSTIRIARFGDYTKGEDRFSITRDDADAWQRALAEHFNGEAPIDLDHSPEKGKGTEAAGWIKGLRDDGEYVLADVEWTDLGEEKIKSRRYRYVSPTFHPNWQVEGKPIGRALLGAALSNRPYLRRGMAALSLSEDPVVTDFEQPQVETPAPSDSRRVTKLAEIAKALGLEDGADETQVLEAATDLQGRVPDPGTVTLSAEDVADLQRKANAGEAAAKTLAETRFNGAWGKAVTEGRVAPAQEETFKALADTNLDLAVTTLDGLQPIVKTQTAGSGDAPADDPKGVERTDLDRRARALAAEEKISYTEAAIRLSEDAGE